MPLLPRWRFMTEQSKALTRRFAISGGLLILALQVFRALLPWMLLAVVLWWIWTAINC